MSSKEHETKLDYTFDKAVKTNYIGRTSKNTVIYGGHVNKEWSTSLSPHVSSYITAIAMDSMLQHYSTRYQKDPIALSCFFFDKSLFGHIIVEIEDIKVSNKGYCFSRATTWQTETVTVPPTTPHEFEPSKYGIKTQCMITMGNLREESGRTSLYKEPQMPDLNSMQPHPYVSMDSLIHACIDTSYFPRQQITHPDGTTTTRLHSMVREPISGLIPGQPELHQLLRFVDDRPLDLKSIPYWCDVFIPPIFFLGANETEQPMFFLTMQLEVFFKRIPKGKEVISSFVTHTTVNGRGVTTGNIWDREGDLVAVTRQQSLVLQKGNKGPKSDSKI
ncbi:thioesterase-like superfamily-domain-containing protein [Spinellus fusiger]|nr:thioesterase-like superfamily-domain-containing protein [Spinellus fusiger]